MAKTTKIMTCHSCGKAFDREDGDIVIISEKTEAESFVCNDCQVNRKGEWYLTAAEAEERDAMLHKFQMEEEERIRRIQESSFFQGSLFCPLANSNCRHDQCAWWREGVRNCAVPDIASALVDIRFACKDIWEAIENSQGRD